ncbi:MAG TPA: ATP-binding cassette domain-containing protein [Urbifossiella sp.]|nr:ATP-binding cassette domain-containing protein [Urbifossiella sp.]
MQIPAGAFVGILGASGSGKSSLIRMLAGLDRATSGEVRLAAAPCTAQQLLTDRRVSYLPQQPVMHEALTPVTSLRYSAQLQGLGAFQNLSDLVELVLHRVGLEDRADVPIVRLSGGQKKRVALAAELLGNPGLLLLDEATSGLDPATEVEMMELFRSLADEGRTVVCVTHTPESLGLCDRVVVLAEGLCVFDGPPIRAPQFFGVQSLGKIYASLAQRAADSWRKQFLRAHPGHDAPPEQSLVSSDETLTTREPFARQTAVLISRYFRLQLADFRAIALQLLQAPTIALLIGGSFGNIQSSFAEQHAADSRQVLFVLVIAVLWCSGSASAREIVKELPIIRHEVRHGLNLKAYLISKFALLGGLALFQALVLVMIVRSMTHLTGSLNPQCAVLGMTALAGVGIGLWISSIAGTSERAMTLLPVVLIGLAVFSGGLARLTGLTLWLARGASPAYWAFDGLKAPLGSGLRMATYPGAPGVFQPPILGPGGPLALDLAALALQTSVLLVAAFVILRLKIRS